MNYENSRFLFQRDSFVLNQVDFLDDIDHSIRELLENWFASADFLQQLAIPFGATVAEADWTEQAIALQQSILEGRYTIHLELRSAAELEGAFGAYSPTGTTTQPTIYLNADWLEVAAIEDIQAVLLEELGHDFDRQINQGIDSRGDEGAIFAALVQDTTLTAPELAHLQAEDDRNTITIDGQALVVEQAIDLTSASSQWVNLARTGDPNKGSVDGVWTANASDFVGNDTTPYLQIQADDTSIAFKVLAEPQSGRFKSLMGIFVDVDGDGSPDFTIQVNVANDNGSPTGYSVGEYDFIPIFAGTANPDANTRPNNTEIPAANTNTYFDLGANAANFAVEEDVSDLDGDGPLENYYIFSFTLSQLAAFRDLVKSTYNGGTENSLYKEIPAWPTERTKVYAAGLTASNSLNAVNGDIGGGPFDPSTTWKDIFGFEPALPPVATNDTLTVLEDSGAVTGNLLINDTDPNNDPLVVSQFVVNGTTYPLTDTNPSQTATLTGIGTLTLNQDGSYSFTPLAGYTGPVPITTYTVTDDSGLSNTATLAISLSPVNDAPAGADKTVTLNEDTTYTFTASDFGFTDPNDSPADSLQSVIITTLPNHGTLSLNGNPVTVLQAITAAEIPTLTFTPAANGNGAGYASLTFQVRDDGGTANGGVDLDPTPNTLTFDVNAINDAPIAVADLATAVEAGGDSNTIPGTDPSGNVLTNDTDPDIGDTLTVNPIVNATGQYGSLTINANGDYTYTVDNDNATVQALRTPAHTLTETFTYTVQDPAGATATNTLTVTIQGANDAPIAADDFNTAKESITTPAAVTGTNATGNVLSNDTDVDGNGETKTIAGLTAAATGITPATFTGLTVTIDLASLTGTIGAASGGYKGDAVFQFDGTNWVDSQMRVDAIAGNTLTLVPASGATVSQITVTDNENLQFYKTQQGNNNVITPLNLVATADTDVTGTATASTTINVTNLVDTIFVGMAVTGTGIPGGTMVSAVDTINGTVTLNNAVLLSTDTNLTFSGSLGSPITGQYGELILNADGSYTYTPFSDNSNINQGEVKTESFSYTMQDGSGATSNAVLTIQVEGTGTPDPIANPDTALVNEAGGLNNDTAIAPTSPIVGNVKTNDTDPQGAITFGITEAGTTSTTLSAVTAGSTSVSNATSISGSYGTLNIGADGSYTYTLDNTNAAVEALRISSDTLTETFSYRVTDADGNTSGSTLVITIQGANDHPVATADTATATEAGGTNNDLAGFSPSGNLLTNDSDKDAGDTQTVSGIMAGLGTPTGFTNTVAGTYGTLTINTDGSYSYTVADSDPMVNALAAGETVQDSFTYEVTDAAGAKSTASLTITVNGANDAPENAVPGSLIADENTTLAITTLSVSDPENDAGQSLSSELATVQLTVTNGQLAIAALNGATISQGANNSPTLTLSGTQEQINAALATLSYQGNPNFSGTDVLTITATDGLGLEDMDVIAITVNPDARPLTVSSPTVNEKSPYAVFVVDGVADQQVDLTLTAGSATLGSDFSPNLEYWNGSAWAEYMGSPVTISTSTPSSPTNPNGELYVRTAIFDDAVYESAGGGETFTLTATNNAGTPAIGTATILDDGTGAIYKDDGTVDSTATPQNQDDDRPLTVSDPIVNEASPYIIFEVGGAAGQLAKLTPSENTATSGLDYGTALEYWTGSAWVDYLPNSFIPIPSGGTLLVRTTVNNDGIYEGSENFALAATNTGGNTTQGLGAIVDDGTGTKYTGNVDGSGNPITDNTSLENDLSVSVTAFSPVNEASPYALFTVMGTVGQDVLLTLGNTADPGDADATITNFRLEYSLDGTTWVTYSAIDDDTQGIVYAVPRVPASGSFYVRTEIISENDTTYEGPETFTLTANLLTGTGATGSAIATIVDDGSGNKYPGTLTGTVPDTETTALDDDRALIVNTITVNEGSPYAIFTVTGAPNQQTQLALSNNSATSPTDFGNALEYWDGANWQPYTANALVTLSATGTLYVRNPIVNDDPAVFEGAETFTLTATNTGGTAATGTGTIVDDGTGVKYPGVIDSGTGNPVEELTSLDDDRALTVSDVTVSEADAYAVFTVTGVAGATVSLVTAGSGANPAIAETDSTLNNGEDFGNGGLEYSTDGGGSWTPYTADITIPVGGSFQVRTNITPDTISEPAETFALTATYTTGGTQAAIGTATIQDGNAAPIPNGTIGSQTSDDAQPITDLNITTFFNDPNSDPLTYSATGLPGGLSLDTATGIISGTLDNSASQGGTNGMYTVTVTANDGKGGTANQTFSWTVGNPTPTATSNTGSVNEDGANASGNLITDDTGAGTDSDPDGDGLAIASINSDTTGTVNGTYGTLTWNSVDGSYTYALNNGNPVVQGLGVGETLTDTFTYTLSDGEGGTDTATLEVTINGANDTPETVGTVSNQNNNDAQTITNLDLSAFFNDPDGDTLTYSATGLPTGLSFNTTTGIISGTLNNSASQGGTNGMYTVTVTANDGKGGTANQTFTWTVGNPTPTATNNIGEVTKDNALSQNGNLITDDTGAGIDSDPDSDPLTIASINGDTTGTVTGSYGSLTWGSNGTYTYVLDNGNTAVQALGPSDTLTETFTYLLSDGEGGTDTATLVITVNGANDAPIAIGTVTNQTSNDGQLITPLNLSTYFDEPNGDPLTYTATGLPPGLSLDLNTGILSGTLDQSASQGGTNGVYTLIVTADDGQGGTTQQTFSWTVGNPAPTASDNVGAVTKNSTLSQSGNLITDDTGAGVDNDPDQDALTIASINSDTTGTVTGSYGSLTWGPNGTYTYTLDNGNTAVQALGPNDTLTETFTYVLSDGEGGTDTATLVITVNGINQVPNAASDTFDGEEDQPVTGNVLTNDDIGDGPIMISADASSANGGTVTIAPDGNFSYTPAPNFHGPDTFAYTITDANGDVATAIVTINVNAGPDAVIDTFIGQQGQTISGNVLVNDDLGDGPTSISQFDGTTPNGGIVTLTPDGNFNYTPAAGFSGTDTFTYTITDFDGDTSTIAVSLTVNPAPIKGSGGSDKITGGDGDDVINGLSDNDILDGGAGNDVINGGSEEDILIGGLGNDVLNGGSGNDQITAGEGDDVADGGSGNDTITGDAGDDLLNGGSGDDTLAGGSGQDVLQGSDGQDLLLGGEGDDFLDGGQDNDTLIGGNGADLLTGGQGEDVFKYTAISEFGDTITDFEIVSDRIDLSSIAGLSFASLSFQQVGDDTFINLLVGNTPTPIALLQDVNAITLDSENFVFSSSTSGGTGSSDRPSTLSLDQADDYLASHGDLIQAYGYNLEAAQNHYAQYGYQEGRAIDIFAEDIYLASHGDLIAAYGYNLTAATRHYIEYGYGEGRTQQGFIPERYVAAYGDLQNAYGNDLTAATRHYIEYGYSEGRDPLLGFNGGAYIASYSDLVAAYGYNPQQGRQHYLEYGYAEGRTATFEADDYIASYGDLILAFQTNLELGIQHYISYGIGEGRAPDQFDEVAYLNKYNDLQAAYGNDTEAATLHYIQFGFAEGRTA